MTTPVSTIALTYLYINEIYRASFIGLDKKIDKIQCVKNILFTGSVCVVGDVLWILADNQEKRAKIALKILSFIVLIPLIVIFITTILFAILASKTQKKNLMAIDKGMERYETKRSLYVTNDDIKRINTFLS